MIFLPGKYFSLPSRSGKENRSLTFGQLRVVYDRHSKRDKLVYNSYGEKNLQGGLKDRKNVGKCVEHHENMENESNVR